MQLAVGSEQCVVRERVKAMARVMVRVAEGEVEKAMALLEEAFELGLKPPERLEEWLRIVVKDRVAGGAGELTTWVGFEPTKRFLDLLAASRAGKGN